jgi:hypothetical protein
MTCPIDLSTRECYLGDGGEHGVQAQGWDHEYTGGTNNLEAWKLA